MADTAVETPATPAGEKKGTKGRKSAAGKAAAAKPKAKKPSHPPTSEMVTKAIGELKERGGSSLQAIKKYIAANYKVDADKIAPFIKKYLKGAVESGALVRTKGKGAAGSFKLEGKPKAAKAAPAKAKKTKGVEKKVKKVVAAKKPAAKPKKAPAKKPAKPKTPTKAKKTTKPPTKPKTPKAKRGVSAKSRTIKKAKK